MRKFIQISSLLALVLAFTTFSVKAAGGFGSEVEIPFAFYVGDKAYEAGHYIVRVQRLETGGAILSIQNSEDNKVHSLFLNRSGDPGSSEVKLIFDVANGQRYLSKVTAQDHSFAVIGSKERRTEVGKAKRSTAAEIGGGGSTF